MKQQISFHSKVHKSTDVNIDNRLKQVCLKFYTQYSKDTVIDIMYNDSVTIAWPCFECKKEVNVNIESLLRLGHFSSSQLFCTLHKPSSQRSLHSHLFIRYEDGFIKHLKSNILDKTISQYNN